MYLCTSYYQVNYFRHDSHHLRGYASCIYEFCCLFNLALAHSTIALKPFDFLDYFGTLSKHARIATTFYPVIPLRYILYRPPGQCLLHPAGEPFHLFSRQFLALVDREHFETALRRADAHDAGLQDAFDRLAHHHAVHPPGRSERRDHEQVMQAVQFRYERTEVLCVLVRYPRAPDPVEPALQYSGKTKPPGREQQHDRLGGGKVLRLLRHLTNGIGGLVMFCPLDRRQRGNERLRVQVLQNDLMPRRLQRRHSTLRQERAEAFGKRMGFHYEAVHSIKLRRVTRR